MEKTGEVCLDDDKFGQKGFQQRPNHQIGAVGWPRSEISSIGGGGHLRLATNWRPFGKCRLIVDDSKVIRMVARKILQELDFETVEAADGKQALDACITKMPDAVLLDWNMPVMSGIEFLRELRALPTGGGPIVVFCTTENDIQHIQEAIEAGANEYIMKPFDSEIIQAKFTQVGLL